MKYLVHKFVCSCCIIVLSLNAFGQNSTIINLWPGVVPGEQEVKHPGVVMDNHKGGVTRVTDVTDPTLTVFTPKSPGASNAAVLVCPGGGYSYLCVDKEGSEIAHWLNRQGIAAFVLQYRVPHKEKGALQDAQRAIRLVRAHASQWHINPEEVGVMGFSAGGSLSARISTEYNKELYNPVDKADRLSAKPDFALLIYPAYLDRGPNHTLTSEIKIDSSTPPMFIFQTADDPYGHSSLVMANALREKKVAVEMHLYSKGKHGYGMRKGNPAAETWPPLAEKWLNRMLNRKKMDIYLLIGQSNMAGRAPVDTTCSDTLRNVYLFTGKKFIPAANPLNKYSTVRKPLSWQKLGPGYGFAKKLEKYSGKKIGLVVNARGGTKIEWWEKGYSGKNDFDLYESAVRQIKKAEKYGTLKAILWHQGESNHNNPEDYMQLLKKLVNDLRRDLGRPNVYFLAGELGQWKSSFKKMNEVIDKIPVKIKNAGVVSSNALTPLHGDTTNPHFNTKSQLLLGKRYADKILKKIYPIDRKK